MKTSGNKISQSLLSGLVILIMSASLFAATSIYDFTLPSIDGKPAPLANYKGKVVLLVNVASRCGFTPQYTALESTYEKYKDKGFVILGFPANNFGSQEPGTNAEIKTFCQSKYSVQFPLFEKIVVKGEGQHPLYNALVEAFPKAQPKADSALRKTLDSHGLGPKNDTDIMWNFEKFVVNRDGKVVARFAPDFKPGDPEVTGTIESELAK